MNSEALIRTAKAIATSSVPDLGFNMRTFFTNELGPNEVDENYVDVDGLKCSTICCGAGWAVAVHGNLQEAADALCIDSAAADILDLDHHETYALFYCHPDSVDHMKHVTRDMCVNTYLYAAEHDKVDWNAAQVNPPKRPWVALVTDEMVEAALDQWYAGEDWRTTLRDHRGTQRKEMRAALEAALAVKERSA